MSATAVADSSIVVAGAREEADRAANAAGIIVREIQGLDDVERLSKVIDGVWGRQGRSIVSTDLALALAHSGNYVAAAFRDGTLLGGLVGFRAEADHGIDLYSHVMGVTTDARSNGVGFALKLHQRAWAMYEGLRTAGWTTDPLVRRNGYFNLAKLGASVERYYPNFYGAMGDEINGVDDSDRILVLWRLDSERAISACQGRREEFDLERELALGAEIALSVGPSGQPVGRAKASRPRRLLIQVPADIVSIRGQSPALARAWRRALREAMAAALNTGYETRGMTRSGHYVLGLPN